ncbi:hypothetical protein ABZ851_30265 [Streptomyces sp. NPDC047049]|uniref:hypothetical protein n=1 Tax=Streptomyces sp. NPDC047049 TaxID=3156688 RepID=UPI0033DA3972
MTTRTPNAQPLGLGHIDHPLLGHLVVDHAHGDRIGVLRAVAPDADGTNLKPVLRIPATPPVAWLAPRHGGLEWNTDPDEIEAVVGDLPMTAGGGSSL